MLLTRGRNLKGRQKKPIWSKAEGEKKESAYLLKEVKMLPYTRKGGVEKKNGWSSYFLEVCKNKPGKP